MDHTEELAAVLVILLGVYAVLLHEHEREERRERREAGVAPPPTKYDCSPILVTTRETTTNTPRTTRTTNIPQKTPVTNPTITPAITPATQTMSSDTQIPLDNIHLRNIQLPLAVTVGRDAWHRDDKPQPATISLRIGYPSSLIASASETDTVAQTLDYGKLYRAIEANIAQSPGMNLFGLSSAIRVPAMLLVQETLESAGFSDPTNDYFLWRETEIFIHLPKAILRAEQGIRYRTFHLGAVREEHDFTIEGIRCYCIVGINPHERREKQAVVVTLSFSFSNFKNTFRFLDVYQELAQDVAESVDSSSFQTVEALATSVAKIALGYGASKQVTVRVEKPSAQPFVELSGVEITRTADFFQK